MISNKPVTPPRSLLKLAGWPQVCVLDPTPDPESVFLRLCHLPGCIFLDSSSRHDALGRYSFIAADPFATLCLPVGTGDLLSALKAQLAPFATKRRPDLPPFQGGAAGLFGYELAHSLERLPPATHDEFLIPAIHLGLYDVVIAFDHLTKLAWVISQGWPETDPARRQTRAFERMLFFHGRAKAKHLSTIEPRPGTDIVSITADHIPIERYPGLFSNFSQEAYKAAVSRAMEHIRAGDIFQTNLAQRLMMRAHTASPTLFSRLRRQTQSTFAAYYDAGDFQVVSASPERFLSVRDRTVESRPIKGTRRLTQDPQVDQAAAAELQSNAKERAENIMIVDLVRNDLSRVCETESIRVPQLCGVESCGYVQHLVSVVTGRLADEYHAADVIQAAFPGGSVTGAPKKRAMEILTEIEQTARGAYCGSLGYVGADGSMDLNILIRTITAKGGWWQFPVGGAITTSSDPSAEYEETWHKAAGLLSVLLDDQS